MSYIHRFCHKKYIISCFVRTELPTLAQKTVAFCRLSHPVNLGPTCEEALFIILVVSPGKEKATKNIVETGSTYSTLFTDIDFRYKLSSVSSKDGFRQMLKERAVQMMKQQGNPETRKSSQHLATSVFDEDDDQVRKNVLF